MKKAAKYEGNQNWHYKWQIKAHNHIVAKMINKKSLYIVDTKLTCNYLYKVTSNQYVKLLLIYVAT